MTNGNDKTNNEVANGNSNSQQPRSPNAAIIRHQSFEGPLPPPEILLQYERISAGLAERIVRMAELQGDHRRHLESTHLTAQIQHLERADKEARWGQIFAFVIGMTAIIGGTIAIIMGSPGAGSFIGALGIGSIVTSFIHGRFSQDTKKEDDE